MNNKFLLVSISFLFLAACVKVDRAITDVICPTENIAFEARLEKIKSAKDLDLNDYKATVLITPIRKEVELESYWCELDNSKNDGLTELAGIEDFISSNPKAKVTIIGNYFKCPETSAGAKFNDIIRIEEIVFENDVIYPAKKLKKYMLDDSVN